MKKFLFTFSYSYRKDSKDYSGIGSARICNISNKITESKIDNAIDVVTQNFKDDGCYDINIIPMGWFKFDEDEE